MWQSSVLLTILFLSIGYQVTNAQTVIPGHSHNDYENEEPLTTALSHDFMSIEIDIHLINDELYVAHDTPVNPDPDRTLEKLYLRPLVRHIKKNKGVVYKGYEGPFFLMMDIKTEANSTYWKMVKVLSRYSKGIFQTGQVVVLLSGNRPVNIIARERPGKVRLDGRLTDLKEINSDISPVMSDNYNNHFGWDGNDQIPDEELVKLKELVEEVHHGGRLLRLWAAPDKPNCWQVLLDEGVDLINTDRISEFSDFMKTYRPR